MARRWKKEEETYLKRYARTRRLEELAERFKTDTETVVAKLETLGLQAKDGTSQVKVEHDPLVKVYERGVKALHKEKWKDAQKLFEQIVDDSDFPVLAQRARQYVALCAERLAKPPAGAADPFLQAVYERNQGNLEAALELCSKSGRQSKDERFAYLAAAIYSTMGDEENAAKSLEVAIEMEPKNRVRAYYDSDFDGLRANAEYAPIFDA